MSVENNSNVAVLEAPVVETTAAPVKKVPTPRKKPTPKPATPAAKTTPAPKEKKPVAAKKEEAAPAAPNKKNTGLRKPQVRILATLVKVGKALSRKEIAEKAEVDAAWLTSWIGSTNPEVRTANDAKEFPSLITLGFVKQEKTDVDGKDVICYAISAKGKAALEKAEKA